MFFCKIIVIVFFYALAIYIWKNREQNKQLQTATAFKNWSNNQKCDLALECNRFVVEVGWLPDKESLLSPYQNMADIMVEKNSFGGTGCVRMHFVHHAGFREAP